MVKLGNVGALDLANTYLADGLFDVGLGVEAVPDDSVGFAMRDSVFFNHALAELGDGHFKAGLLARSRWVFAALYAAEHFDGLAAGLVCGQDSVHTKADPPIAAANAVLNKIGSAAARQNSCAKARDVAIEDDVVFVFDLGVFNQALGDFGHGVGASFQVFRQTLGGAL